MVIRKRGYAEERERKKGAQAFRPVRRERHFFTENVFFPLALEKGLM